MVNTAFVRAMYKEGTGNDKQRKDAGNRMLCPYRNFSQAIKHAQQQKWFRHEKENFCSDVHGKVL